MGTGLADMAWTTALSLVLYSLSYLQAQDICCKIKIVSGTLADDQGLSGTYTLLRDAGAAPDEACANGCVYSRDGMGRCNTHGKSYQYKFFLSFILVSDG